MKRFLGAGACSDESPTRGDVKRIKLDVGAIVPKTTRLHNQFFRHKLCDMRKSTKKRNENKQDGTARNHAECTLKIVDLQELHAKQHGRCYISGIVLQCRTLAKWQASPERLDNTRGYTKDNTVLIALEFNTAKQWNRAKFAAMFIDELPTLSMHVDFSVTRNKPVRHEYPVNAEGSIRCWKCLEYRGLDMYYHRKFAKGCRTCRLQYTKSYQCSPRGRLGVLLSHSKGHHERRSLKNTYETQHQLSLDDLILQYWKQGGLCYYSDMPLQFDRPDEPWLISLERIDVAKTYTADNVVLICAELNATDNGRKCGNSNFGWSRAKVAEVRAMYRV